MNIVFLYFFISGLLAFFTTIYLFYKHKKENNLWILLFLLASGLYSFGYSMELLSKGYTLSLFWVKFEYIGLSFYSSLIFLSALEYKNKSKKIFLKSIVLLVSALFLLLFLWNHNLLFENLVFKKTPFASITVFKSTLLYKLENIFDIILGILAVIIFGKYIFQSIKGQKKFFMLITSLIIFVIFFGLINIIIDDSISFYFVSILDTVPIYIWFYLLVIRKISNKETLYYDKVFESSPMEIIVLDKTFFIIDENQSAKESFGVNLKKNIFLLSPEIFRCLNRSITRINGLFINENFYNISISEYKKNENIIGYVLNFNNITDLKNAENNLEQLNKELLELSHEREELILTISHDLRTPLNGIKGLTELALINESCSLEYLNNISASSDHMLNLLNEILLSKKNDSNTQFSFIKLFDEVSLTFMKACKDKGIFFLQDIGNEIPTTVCGEMNKLKQILFNIVENSVKYTENGGIFLKLHSQILSPKKTKVLITIEDTGIGIENVQEVFEKFYKENSILETSSYGIGLFNTKKLIESLGGNIEIQSKRNSGTKVVIEITMECVEPPKKIEKIFNKSCVVISKSKLINKFFSGIFQENGINFYILESFHEYQEIKDEIIEEPIVFSLGYIPELLETEKYFVLDFEKNENFNNFLSLEKLNRNCILDSLGLNYGLESNLVKHITIPNYLGVKALIIEDNLLNIYYLEEILNMLIVSYDTGKNLEEARNFLSTSEYEIIFSDINLGETNSLAFIKSLETRYEMIKIALTASVTENMKNLCLSNGFNDFIGKPYKIEEVIHVFDKYFANWKSLNEKNMDKFENLQEYYNIFFNEIPNELIHLNKSIEELDWSNINKISHKIKSGAYIIKETQLIDSLIAIEKHSQNYDKSNLGLEFNKMKNILVSIEKKVKYENCDSRG